MYKKIIKKYLNVAAANVDRYESSLCFLLTPRLNDSLFVDSSADIFKH